MILNALTINKKNLIVNKHFYAVRFILPDCERENLEWVWVSDYIMLMSGEGKMLSFHSTRILCPLPIQSLSIWISFSEGSLDHTHLVFWSGAECNQSSVFYFAGVKVRAASLFHLTGCLSHIKSTWFHCFILVCLREPLRNSSILSSLRLILNIVNHTSSSGYLSIA